MIGADIKTYLSTVGGFSDISVNYVSETKSNAISIMETGGNTPVRPHGIKTETEVIQNQIDRPTFQVILRRSDKPTAEQDIKIIRGLLDGITLQDINGTRYISITQTATAAYLGKVRTDEGDSNEYSLNFEAQIKL